MKTEWDHMDIAPCILPSKDNAAALNAAAADQAVWGVTGHAIASSVGGAKKLTEPAEALLNHKDDKNGQHDNFRGYALVKLGHALTFPDTSSTRFGSYLHAAAEQLPYRDCREDRLRPEQGHEDPHGLDYGAASVPRFVQAAKRAEVGPVSSQH